MIQHATYKEHCKGELVTDAKLYQKWGLSAIIQLKCNDCSFVSSKHKLYREVEHQGKGRKCAEPNRSLAVRLLNTSIAAAGAQRLLTSMNKPVPCLSSLHKQLNKVGDIVTSLNEQDLAKQRKNVKDVLENAGYSCDTPIPVEAHRQYNIGLQRRTPFAPTTQTRNVLVKNLTITRR